MAGWRRRWRRRPPPFWYVVALLVLLVAMRGPRWFSPAPRQPESGETALVERAVDGDTLLLADGRRVRLLGVDTPETKHPQLPPEPLGAQASSFTAALVEGKTVLLEYDRERFDKYGRWLAYVYVDGELLNERLIHEGLSEAETGFPYRSEMKRRFREAEQAARAAGKGIWSSPERTGKAPGVAPPQLAP